MPLYEYECSSCGKRFEVIQKFSDEPLSVCKFCGESVSRLISSPAIQFKGTGWYVTDYARKSTTSPADGESKEGKKEDGKPAAASAKESKPAGEASAASSTKE